MHCESVVSLLYVGTQYVLAVCCIIYYLSMNLEDCKKKCLENYSCAAYANTNITGKGSRCLLWFRGLVDIRVKNRVGMFFM